MRPDGAGVDPTGLYAEAADRVWAERTDGFDVVRGEVFAFVPVDRIDGVAFPAVLAIFLVGFGLERVAKSPVPEWRSERARTGILTVKSSAGKKSTDSICLSRRTPAKGAVSPTRIKQMVRYRSAGNTGWGWDVNFSIDFLDIGTGPSDGPAMGCAMKAVERNGTDK